MEVKRPPSDNPFDLSVSRPLLIARFACAAALVAVVICGGPVLAWASVPLLFAVAVIVWGRHVLFFDNLRALPNLRVDARTQGEPLALPPVSLIVAARNEEVGIEAAVRALAATDYPALEILMVEDHSSDRTPQMLERLAAEFPNLRVLAAPDVPEGWAGKPHACWLGFQHTSPQSRWLLFTDARVMFHPNALRRAVEYAETNRLDFLSCILRFDGVGIAEELIAILQNRGLVMSARAFGGGPPRTPFGLGQFMLIRPDIYKHPGAMRDFQIIRSRISCWPGPRRNVERR